MDNEFGEYSTSEDFGKLSRINSAALVNSMLSNLWGDFFRHLRDSKFLNATNDLDCIWTILGGEKKVEGTDIEKNYKSIANKAKDCMPFGILENIKGFNKINDKELKLLAKQKSFLLEKGLFLRRLQNSQGKGTAYQDEDEGDFD